MDLGSGRETSGDQQQHHHHPPQQQQQQQQPSQQPPQSPLSPLATPVSLLMPSSQLQASSYHATPVASSQHPQPQLPHEIAPSAVKLKLLNTASGNGGALQSKGDHHVAADQAREIVRQAVVAVTEAGVAKPSNVIKKGTVRYRECQKNHAASIGGHAIDGCGEFMPGGEDGSVDALRCAACDCHRNFHRREVEGEVVCDCKKKPKLGLGQGGLGLSTPSQQQHQPSTTTTTMSTPVTTTTTTPLLAPALALPMAPLTMAALSAGGGGPTDSDEGPDDGPGNNNNMMMSMRSPSAIKKRFRTKFTTEQKDQMCAFAEKVGWRIQKHDEAAVQEFCATAGVKRHVLKVWMHNNKHTMGKKP